MDEWFEISNPYKCVSLVIQVRHFPFAPTWVSIIPTGPKPHLWCEFISGRRKTTNLYRDCQILQIIHSCSPQTQSKPQACYNFNMIFLCICLDISHPNCLTYFHKAYQETHYVKTNKGIFIHLYIILLGNNTLRHKI